MSELIEQWMVRMEGKVDGLREDIAALKSVRDQVDEHHERIYGNGQPGLIKDVDRLKQWRRAIYWWIGIGITVASAPAIAEVLKILLEPK